MKEIAFPTFFHMIISMIGIHLRLTNDIESIRKCIDELQIDCFQLFFEPFHGLSMKRKLHYRAIFSRLKKEKMVRKIFVHAPDNTSLRVSKNNTTIPSWKKIRYRLQEADDLGVDGLVVHVNIDRTFPLQMMAEEMSEVLYDIDVKSDLLLENTVMQNSISSDMHTFDHMTQILHEKYPIKICLDTAHLFSVGYSFSSKDEMRELIREFPSIFRHTKLVHMNDSAVACGSFIDHHAHLGKGFLGLGSLGAVVSVFSRDMPYITETPKCDFDVQKENIVTLNQIVAGNKLDLDELGSHVKMERVFYF
jgi:deoxyribonuclease-4